MPLLADLLTELQEFLNRLSMWDLVIISINVLLLIFAQNILKALSKPATQTEKQFKLKVNTFRALNLLIICVLAYQRMFSEMNIKSYGFKVISILMLIYMAYLFLHIINHFIGRHYGRVREINGEKRTIETYQSRMLSIIVNVFVFIIVLLSVVKILGFDSLLEAGGVLGVIGVFLALTQASWAPDIVSGLIILNSGMVEEGDVIELPGVDGCLGVVFKTKVFHTEILNLVNNHRIMFKNAKLREQTIHNLSKFASAKGLRERLLFKIGYDTDEERVKAFFNKAFEVAVQDPDVVLEERWPLEVGVEDTGDHAVLWSVYYYTKDVRRLLRTRQLMRELILKLSKEEGLELQTPLQHVLLDDSSLTAPVVNVQPSM